jgi:hypothetical protein
MNANISQGVMMPRFYARALADFQKSARTGCWLSPNWKNGFSSQRFEAA